MTGRRRRIGTGRAGMILLVGCLLAASPAAAGLLSAQAEDVPATRAPRLVEAAALLEAVTAASGDELAITLALAEAASTHALAPHAGAAATAERDAARLAQVSRNAAFVPPLLAALDAADAAPLARAVDAAKLAAAWQAETAGLTWSAPPAAEAHALPSEALLALAARHDVAPTPEQLDAIRSLDALDAPARDALTRLVDVFLAFEAATLAAYDDVDLGALDRLRQLVHAGAPDAGSIDGAPLDPPSVVRSLGLDVQPVLAARNELLDAAVAFDEVFGAGALDPSAPAPRAFINLCPAFAVDLLAVNNVYAADCALILDVGGNDDYENNAGGSDALSIGCATVAGLVPAGFGAAALVDLRGDDVYGTFPGRSCGVNGGGFAGSGFLMDAQGDDLYHAGHDATNGGGLAGLGFLLDGAGYDNYVTDGSASNGGGSLGGSGTLLDVSGDDVYTMDVLASNGGGVGGGIGFLLDTEGNDVYNAVPSFAVFCAYPFTGSCGTNGGGWFGGVGTLLDVAGVDEYWAGVGGVNGGAGTVPNLDPGVGFLLDARGCGDWYDDGDGGTGFDNRVVPKGALGAQLDLPMVGCGIPPVPDPPHLSWDCRVHPDLGGTTCIGTPPWTPPPSEPPCYEVLTTRDEFSTAGFHGVFAFVCTHDDGGYACAGTTQRPRQDGLTEYDADCAGIDERRCAGAWHEEGEFTNDGRGRINTTKHWHAGPEAC